MTPIEMNNNQHCCRGDVTRHRKMALTARFLDFYYFIDDLKHEDDQFQTGFLLLKTDYILIEEICDFQDNLLSENYVEKLW